MTGLIDESLYHITTYISTLASHAACAILLSYSSLRHVPMLENMCSAKSQLQLNSR